jgi:hypothetical protein
LVLAVAAAVPACGGSSGGGTAPGANLFSDNFNVYPDALKWTANGGGGTDAQDAVNGSPAPSLSMTGSTNDDPSITSVTAFTTPSLTLSVRVACQAGSTKGTAVVTVAETSGPTAAFFSWDSATGATVFDIDGTAAAGPVLAADGAFHTVVFKVDGAGNMTINLDGGATEVGPVAWPATNTNTLSLTTNIPGGGGTPAIFNFDTVSVTSP